MDFFLFLSALLQFLIFSYPVSGQLVSPRRSLPPSGFSSWTESPQKNQQQWDSQVPFVLQPPDAPYANGQTFSPRNTYFPGSSSLLPTADSSPVFPESQPNLQANPPENAPIIYPVYDPSSPSSQPEYQSDTFSLSPTSNFFSNPNIYSKPLLYPFSPDFLSSLRSSSFANQPSLPSFQSSGESHDDRFPFLPQSGKVDQQSFLEGQSPLSSSLAIQSEPTYQPPLFPPLPSDTSPSSSPLNYRFIQPSGLDEQPKLSPGKPLSSPVFSFPDNVDPALFSAESSSPNFESGVSRTAQNFPSQKSLFSPEPFAYGPIFQLSQSPSAGFGGSQLLNSPSSFSDLPNTPSFTTPLPFETFLSPPYSSELFSEPYRYSQKPPPFPPFSVSGVPDTPLDHSLVSHEEKSTDLFLLPPEVSEPVTLSSVPETIPQIMTPYEPELPANSNCEPTLPSFPSIDSPGSLDLFNGQSEPSGLFSPSDTVSKQPSPSQSSPDFSNLFEQKLEPSEETIVSTANEESANQFSIMVNGSSKWPNNSVVCPVNERYLKCGPSCPRTCQNFIQNLKCEKKGCKSGCFCKRGYIRNKYGNCVTYRNCNPAICRRREIFRSCAKCETTCENYGNNSTCSSDKCVRGCICRNGLVRRSDGRCVRPHYCKIEETCDNPDETHYNCIPTCNNTCENYNQHEACSYVCKPGCFCKAGLIRNSANECVSPEQCDTRSEGSEEAISSSSAGSSGATSSGSSTSTESGSDTLSEASSSGSSSASSTESSGTNSDPSSASSTGGSGTNSEPSSASSTGSSGTASDPSSASSTESSDTSSSSS